MKARAGFIFLLMMMEILVSSCAGIGTPGVEKNVATTSHFSSIMMVLGSSDPATRAARIALACDLMKEKGIHFDTIILTGGCGAHGTDAENCEATDMEQRLKASCPMDISGVRIYREEKSRSTIENYCNCRKLEQDGEKLIEDGDLLYVVSNHPHALSVAACFKNQGVDAYYYYTCGKDLYDGEPPSVEEVAASTDPCFSDYAGIARNCSKSDWCEHTSLPPGH